MELSTSLIQASASRRRSKAQIEEEKLESVRKEQEIKEKLAAWDQMEAALEESERKQQHLREQSEAAQQIYDDGLIKKSAAGGYEVVDDPEEQQDLLAKRSKTKRRGNIEPHIYDDVSVDLDLQEGELD